MSSDESVLKVVLSYVPGEAAKTRGEVKLVPSGKKSGSNLRVPRTDGSNVEQMLAETIIPVTKAAANAPNEEQDKFKFIQLLFDDPIQEVFDGVADELQVDVANPADGDFLMVVEKFLSEMTSGTKMRDNILRYLETSIRKPRAMHPARFGLRFLTILSQAKYFEGIKPFPTPEEKMDWYFRAFPVPYRLDYKKHHGDEKESLQAITKHMTLLHEADEAAGVFKEKKPSTKDKAVTKDEKGTDRRRRQHKRDREKSSHSKKPSELSADMHCPVHPDGKHTWGECSQNPANKKDDKQDDKKRDRRSNKDDKKGKKREKLSSHHIDDQRSDDSSTTHEEGEEVEDEAAGSDSDVSSHKRMKHNSHHADADDLSEKVEDMEIVPDAFPEE